MNLNRLDTPSFPFERRSGFTHLRIETKPKKIFIFLWTLCGGGISFLRAFNPTYRNELKQGIYNLFISAELQQKYLEEVLSWAPFLRSIEIRDTSTPYELNILARRRHLRHLWLGTRISSAVDLSKLRKLETLGSSSNSISKFSGLSELSNLKYVHVRDIKVSWFDHLPINIERLYVSGKFPFRIDLRRLVRLEVLGVNGCRELVFSNLAGSNSVEQIELTNISNICADIKLAVIFPNLRRAICSRLSEGDFHRIRQANPGIEFVHHGEYR